MLDKVDSIMTLIEIFPITLKRHFTHFLEVQKVGQSSKRSRMKKYFKKSEGKAGALKKMD